MNGAGVFTAKLTSLSISYLPSWQGWLLSIRARRRTTRPVNSDSIRPIADFYNDPRYGGDLHRADMAWAIYAASRGLSQEQIRAEILHARDLSKKGRRGRQLQYAERTAAKAVTSAHPIRP